MSVSSADLHELLRLDLYEAGWLGPIDFPGQTKLQVAMSALDRSIFKKFTNEQVISEADSAALALFLECNDRCASFTGIQPANLVEEIAVGEVKRFLFDFFTGNDLFKTDDPNLLNFPSIARGWSLGNGSNIGAKSTDMYSKFVNSTMAHTDENLYKYYVQASHSWETWRDVEAFRAERYPTELVRGSRLSFVPKTRTISRTICTEPVLNMLFQKGIGDVIERRLRQISGINLSEQPLRNAELARLGSITGEFGTIDLSSASDTISLSLLREILPAQPMRWLMRCRSPVTILPDGREIELHMISSMGNGFTFPLQTTIFTAIVLAAYRVCGVKAHRPLGSCTAGKLGNYGVFGDDIIVDKRAYRLVCRLLTIFGFTVNEEKSFNEGFFRESCGHDYYSGYNVRGVYIKKLLTSNDFYSAINRLNRWSSEHGVLLRRSIKRLRNGCRFIGVPFDEADDAGIKVPLSLFRAVRRDRNGAIEYLASVRVPRMAVLSDDPDGTNGTKLDYADARRVIPGFSYNPTGAYYCLLAGWLRSGSLVLRANVPKSVLRRKRTPGWDTYCAAQGISSDYYKKWEFFVEANLVN